MERETRMAGEPGADLGVLVGAIVVEDHVDHLAGRDLAFAAVQQADELLMRWRCMHWPITVPSSTSSAANSVVVPWRL